jgi:hypothetical protein
MIAYIYGLFDPNDGSLKYVGKTVNIKTRLGIHLRRSRGKYGVAWLRSMLDAGVTPELRVIDTIEYTQETAYLWKDLEKFYIQYMRFLGCPLVNKHIGGSGG